MTRLLEIPRDRPRRSTWMTPLIAALGLLFLLSLHLIAASPDQVATYTAQSPDGEIGAD